MTQHSIIEHRANYYFVKLEEDYLALCSNGKHSPHCKAFILSILEHWMNDKRKKGQKDFVYMTYPQWITSMYGLYGRNVIMDCLSELKDNGLIERQPCRHGGKDTFEYRLNVEEVQQQLHKLPAKNPDDRLPNLDALKKGRVEKRTGPKEDGTSTEPVENRTGDPSKIGRNIESNIDSENIESNTAQSPIGSVLNVSSPSSVHTQEDEPTLPTGLQQTLENFTPRRSNPRPSAPPKEGKNTPPKQASKQAVDPTELERVKSACEKAVGSRFMWIPEELRYAKTLAEGHATDEEIALVVQRLKKTWSKDNITAKTICIHFGNQLSQANLTISSDEPSTQEDKPSRYDDPNFDPRMLSNTESIEYNAWLNAHPQPDAVLV